MSQRRNQFLRNISVLKKAINERKLVVFVGAGLSIDSGIPTWTRLIDELKKDISIDELETDFPKIAQLYQNERDHKDLIDKVRDILLFKKARYNSLHEEIFELNPEFIITTNFDDLLEQVIKSKAYPFSIIKKDKEFPYSRNTKLLVKMHGDLEESNIVLTEEDYLNYSSNFPLIESFIKGLFATKVILFVGYSFSDYNLKYIIQFVKNILGKDFQSAYFLSVDPKLHNAQRQYLKTKNINVINFYDCNESEESNFIDNYLLHSANALNTTYSIQANTLSDTGLRLLKLIKFITKYNEFAENISTLDPVTQIEKSLKRFENISMLPPDFLGNLYPFNNKKSTIYNYDNFTIGSNNKTITKLFQQYYDNQTQKLKESYFIDHNISNTEINAFNRKFSFCLNKLNDSLIYRFGTKNDTLNAFAYPTSFDNTFEIMLNRPTCKCLNCLQTSLNYKDLFQKLQECSINETSNLKDDLLLAYANSKIGNFSLSFDQFEEIANKSWKLDDFVSYFICHRNMKILRNYLDWNFESKPKNQIQNSIEKIEKLDLDRLLANIPRQDDDIYNLIRIIKDQEILLRADQKISEYSEKILTIRELLKRGGTHSGPNYPELIAEELLLVFSFYRDNKLIQDDFLEFQSIMRKGLKAILISNDLEFNYQYKYNYINLLIFTLFAHYTDGDFLETVFKEIKIDTLSITTEDLPNILLLVNNLLESFFTENIYPFNTIEPNKNIEIQRNNFFFDDKIRDSLHVSFILLSKIDLPLEACKEMKTTFIKFLQTEKSLKFHSIYSVVSLLKKIGFALNEDEIISLLNIALEKKFLLKSDDFFKTICSLIKTKNQDYQITDLSLLEKLITISSTEKNYYYIHIWKICDKKCKELIESSISNNLKKYFSSYYYFVACELDIIEPQMFYEEILPSIEQSFYNSYEEMADFSKTLSPNIHNFLILIYTRNLLNDQIPYKNFETLPDYAKFYLRPFNFAYEKFDTKWLLFLKSKIFFKRLQSIHNIKVALELKLREGYNKEYSEIYTRFFL